MIELFSCKQAFRMPRNQPFVLLMIAVFSSAANFSCAQAKKEVTVKIQHNDTTIYGYPIGWNGKQIALLRLDGQLSFVSATSSDAGEVVATDFRPYSPRQLKERLQKEFGKRYDVSITPHFVVVHPWGKREIWAEPFEEFYSRFEYYFSSQGLQLTKPRFPQIVIVLRSRSDFDRHMNKDDLKYDPSVAGYYSRRTNRMITYDPSQLLRVEKDSWLYSSSTVIHEAAHQSAFNYGVHNRFSPPPLWLSEGVAMLFEARGVHHAEKYPAIKDRLNSRRFLVLKEAYEKEKVAGKISQMLVDDRMFQTDTEFAYALAWGLSFYLAENQPKAYIEFLKRDSQRRDFKPYPPVDRLQDFANAFGADFEELEKGMKTFFLGDSDKKKEKDP